MIKKTSAAIAILFTLIGAFVATDSYFAKASDLQLVSLRLELKILNDRYNAVRERIWNLEDKYGDDCGQAPSAVKKEYRKLHLELQEIEREIDRIKVKK